MIVIGIHDLAILVEQAGTLVILPRSSFGKKHVACHLGLDAEKKGSEGRLRVTSRIVMQ